MDANVIYDAVGKASVLVNLQIQIDRKNAEIRDLKSTTCGNCDKWMKNSCIPEKKHKKFKSMSSRCDDGFVLQPWTAELIKERERELHLLHKEINGM